MSRTREDIEDMYGPVETAAQCVQYEVLQDDDGDYWIGAEGRGNEYTMVCTGGDVKDFTAALSSAGVLEGAESGSDRYEDAQEWYDALRDAVDDSFHTWHVVAASEMEDAGPDYDAAVWIQASCRVRDTPFMDRFSDSVAYVRCNPESHTTEFPREFPNEDGICDDGWVGFFVDAPEGINGLDVNTEDPTPSPEDVAKWWYHGVNEMGQGGEIYAPIPHSDIVAEDDDHRQVFVVTETDDDAKGHIVNGEHGTGLWVTELETVEAADVPDEVVSDE